MLSQPRDVGRCRRTAKILARRMLRAAAFICTISPRPATWPVTPFSATCVCRRRRPGITGDRRRITGAIRNRGLRHRDHAVVDRRSTKTWRRSRRLNLWLRPGGRWVNSGSFFPQHLIRYAATRRRLPCLYAADRRDRENTCLTSHRPQAGTPDKSVTFSAVSRLRHARVPENSAMAPAGRAGPRCARATYVASLITVRGRCARSPACWWNSG
jgi:hypothetical protein